jgi:hypothetical protein
MTNNSSVVAVPVCIPFCHSYVELVVIDLLNCPMKVRLFACYWPPSHDDDSAAKAYTSDMCSCIESLIPGNFTVIICRDFNLPSIDWSNMDPCLSSSSTCAGIFLKFFC